MKTVQSKSIGMISKMRAMIKKLDVSLDHNLLKNEIEIQFVNERLVVTAKCFMNSSFGKKNNDWRLARYKRARIILKRLHESFGGRLLKQVKKENVNYFQNNITEIATQLIFNKR